MWGNEKKQKAREGPLPATQSNLAFLESSLWQKEVQRKEEAGDPLEAAMATWERGDSGQGREERQVHSRDGKGEWTEYGL